MRESKPGLKDVVFQGAAMLVIEAPQSPVPKSRLTIPGPSRHHNAYREQAHPV